MGVQVTDLAPQRLLLVLFHPKTLPSVIQFWLRCGQYNRTAAFWSPVWPLSVLFRLVMFASHSCSRQYLFTSVERPASSTRQIVAFHGLRRFTAAWPGPYCWDARIVQRDGSKRTDRYFNREARVAVSGKPGDWAVARERVLVSERNLGYYPSNDAGSLIRARSSVDLAHVPVLETVRQPVIGIASLAAGRLFPECKGTHPAARPSLRSRN